MKTYDKIDGHPLILLEEKMGARQFYRKSSSYKIDGHPLILLEEKILMGTLDSEILKYKNFGSFIS